MTEIFRQTFERSLDKLVENAKSGDVFEAWTFDDTQSRRSAEKKLADRNVRARIHSAYKPLLSFFRENVDLSNVESVEIHYPVHVNAPANRFRLEAYPLASLVGQSEIKFFAREDDEFYNQVKLTRGGEVETFTVFAPNRVHTDIVGETNVSPTGWIRHADDEVGERLITDYESLFDDTVRAVSQYDWGEEEPYFEELNIRVEYPSDDEPLPVADEVISLREALHEDIYFSLLEVFQKRSGRTLGDRGLKAGQIVPEIVKSGSAVTVCVEIRPYSTITQAGDDQEKSIDGAREPLAVAQIDRDLRSIGGLEFNARSQAGRVVSGRHVQGSDAAVMISAGQHANETTGIVGALRAGRVLLQRDGANFTIAPLENPDGYALHQRLRVDNPRHMHHAARYTALGDDLEYRTSENARGWINEKEIRYKAQELSAAQLHVNLHGYPSHEWTRPLSGYVPRNFAMWTLPKGFFLIIRHHAGWEYQAEAMLDRVTRHLGQIPGLLEHNNRQIALYEVHAGETGFQLINGFPCLSSVDDRHDVPLTLITEYPDETIYGDDFVRGHTAQMETVLSAYEAWQELAAVPVV